MVHILYAPYDGDVAKWSYVYSKHFLTEVNRVLCGMRLLMKKIFIPLWKWLDGFMIVALKK